MITTNATPLPILLELESIKASQPSDSPVVEVLIRIKRLDLFEAAMTYRTLRYRWAHSLRSCKGSVSEQGKALLREIVEIDTMIGIHGGRACFAKLHDLIISKRSSASADDAIILHGLERLASYFRTRKGSWTRDLAQMRDRHGNCPVEVDKRRTWKDCEGELSAHNAFAVELLPKFNQHLGERCG
jgi:hypothetical protein